MSLNERERREISDLASRALDGNTPEADRARLEEILLASEDARAYYIRFMDVSAGLAWAARGELVPALTAAPLSHDTHKRAWWAATAAAAVLAFATLGIWVLMKPAAPVSTPAAGIATLSTAMNVEWVDSQEPGHVGNMLKPGWVRMKSGLAQIDFLNGASVWLEGPVEFRLDSPREGYCASGKLVAQVPRAASDFSLATPNMTIADNGTGFGMEVTKGNRTAIHVFRGTVQVTLQESRHKTELGPGQAMSVDHAGKTSMMSADPAAFSREEFGSPYRHYGSPSPWTYPDWSHGPYMGPPPVIFPGQWKGADPMDPVRDLLGADSGRWTQIKQPLEDFLAEQWRSWGLDNNMEEKGVSRARWALMFAVDDPNTTEAELSLRLSSLREARTESRKALENMELKLRKLLTDEEQAKLVTQGYIP